LSDTPPEPTILVFADADDAGVARLVSHLAPRLKVTWWRFGVPETTVSVDVDQTDFWLSQSETSLDSKELRSAAAILYRRRLMRPRPPIASDLASQEDRAFSEREWASLVDGLLLAEETRTNSTWINSPAATTLGNNKLALFLRAARAGLPVPPLSISTPVRFPETASGDLVTKAISANERIDASRYLSTARLSSEDMRDLPGTRLPTPPLLQEYVPPKLEIRAFYALGSLLALALTPSDEHVDIRYSSRAELAPRKHDLPSALGDELIHLAQSQSLSYCTFDLVVPHHGPPLLVDITPNGDWDYFESDATPVVSEFLAGAIIDHVTRGRTKQS
jgi:hypothetical protein